MDDYLIRWIEENLEIFFFAFLCIVVNGWLVRIEVALLESTRSRFEKFSDNKKQIENFVKMLDDNEEILYSGVKFFMTLINMLLGLLVMILLLMILFSTKFFGTPGVVLICVACFGVFLFLNVLFGEFLQKKIALQNPEQILLNNMRLLKIMVWFMKPMHRLFSSCSEMMMLILGINPKIDDCVTEEEVKDLIEQGTEDGTFEKTEQDMVDHIFHMSDQTAYSLMTPRTQMFWLDLDNPLEENLKLIQKNPDNVFPVGRESLDNFRGVVYAKELLNVAIDGKPFEITPYLRHPLLIPRSMESFRVLERFQKSGIHEGIVLDEYGGVIGFLTMNDIVQEIIGETSSESQSTSLQIIEKEKNTWVVDGLCDIDDFKEKFSIEKLPQEEKDLYQTMGGFLVSYFGYIPKVGERCTWQNFSFEILQMDHVRIDQFLLKKIL